MTLTSSDRLSKDIGIQSVVATELELRDVQRQILMTDLVEVAHYAAFDERPEAFDCIRMNRANDVLALVVVNGFMREAMLQSVISGIGVSAKQADLGRDRFADEGFERQAIGILDDAGDDIPLALDCPDDRGFSRIAATARSAFLIPMPAFIAPSDVGFVNFDNTAEFS